MKYLITAIIFTLFATPPLFASQASLPESTKTGEQLIYQVPENWKLAFSEDNENGDFFLEYIPTGEDINSWRSGYLSIQRNPLPPGNVLAKLKEKKIHVATAAVAQYQQMVKKSCPGEFDSMSQGDNTFNGTYVSVTGGFCDRYGESAPHGEGAVIAVLEGQESFFLVKYAWRPNDESENSSHRWRITPETITNYLTSIKQMSVCMPEPGKTCKN